MPDINDSGMVVCQPELSLSVVSEQIRGGSRVRLSYAFQQGDILEGIDDVWTEQQCLGAAVHWIRDRLLELPPDVWRSE